jgi:hypothetical protein
MGTRSLTYVYEDNTPIICMYRQFDGYMSGHGQELAEFLAPFTLVNGIPVGDTRKLANGMGCLSAQLVAHFKVGAGGFYLHVPKRNQDAGQEYEYHVYQDKVVVKDIGFDGTDKQIFKGTWEEFRQATMEVEVE